jgi:hypothetical protein
MAACHALEAPAAGRSTRALGGSLGQLDVKTSLAHYLPMSTPKRATVYFEAEVHKALRLRAAANDRSISDLVNDAVRVSLAEDAADLSAFDRRKKERSVSFDSFVQGMKRRGLI